MNQDVLKWMGNMDDRFLKEAQSFERQPKRHCRLWRFGGLAAAACVTGAILLGSLGVIRQRNGAGNSPETLQTEERLYEETSSGSGESSASSESPRLLQEGQWAIQENSDHQSFAVNAGNEMQLIPGLAQKSASGVTGNCVPLNPTSMIRQEKWSGITDGISDVLPVKNEEGKTGVYSLSVQNWVLPPEYDKVLIMEQGIFLTESFEAGGPKRQLIRNGEILKEGDGWTILGTAAIAENNCIYDLEGNILYKTPDKSSLLYCSDSYAFFGSEDGSTVCINFQSGEPAGELQLTSGDGFEFADCIGDRFFNLSRCKAIYDAGQKQMVTLEGFLRRSEGNPADSGFQNFRILDADFENQQLVLSLWKEDLYYAMKNFDGNKRWIYVCDFNWNVCGVYEDIDAVCGYSGVRRKNGVYEVVNFRTGEVSALPPVNRADFTDFKMTDDGSYCLVWMESDGEHQIVFGAD